MASRGRATPEPRRVGDTVYEALRESIVSGRILPGARLSVPAIAEQYAVSRSPVRDAVIRLVQEGLARDTVNRGAVVAAPEPHELISLYEVREALEWAAARLAAQHTTPGLRRRLLAILAEHEQVAQEGDFTRHIALDAAFHRELRLAADSPVLLRMLDDIQDRVVLAMHTTSLSGGMRRAIEDHRAIFEAVSAGRGEAAAEAARAHITRLKELLRERGVSGQFS
jgi:DNA-binding GntR family transcriptional regulator